MYKLILKFFKIKISDEGRKYSGKWQSMLSLDLPSSAEAIIRSTKFGIPPIRTC
jgi:hypothetical protein